MKPRRSDLAAHRLTKLDPLREIATVQRIRSVLTIGTILVGTGDLFTAVLPPSRRHLTFLLHFMPLVIAQGAAVLLGLCGLVLLALSWGLRRGQRQAWVLACPALAVAAVLHLAHGIEGTQAVVSLGLLATLLGLRKAFGAPIDRRTSGSVAVVALGGLLATILVTTASLELFLSLDRDGRRAMPVHIVALGVTERLAGVDLVTFPSRVNRFLAPTLLGVGIAMAVLAVLAISRPLVDRRLHPGTGSFEAARRLVSDHGGGTLDYFALRHDKWHYITGETLVSYAVHSGVCLVSPDPIGPDDERDEAWAAFCRFADSKGWIVAVLGAQRSWLATYARSGMHSLYVGDEAIVTIAGFSLGGGRKKSLRQAVQRIRKYGYQVSFHDPRQLDPELATVLRTIMGESRRGHGERGFSMTLGRLLDPDDDGLLLAIAHDPDGMPVAFCQFVPAPAIGGYSLDLMRRDRGTHPNGLIDFLLMSTIEHMRERDLRGLSLNFAAMRAWVASDRTGSRRKRLLRRPLRWITRSMQVESLWRFTAKFDPAWTARYLIFASVMHVPAVGLAVARAESLWELPVLGRYLAREPRKGSQGPDRRREPEAA